MCVCSRKAVYNIYDGAEEDCGSLVFDGAPTSQLEANVALIVAVLVWSGVTTSLVLGPLKCCGLLRVGSELENDYL